MNPFDILVALLVLGGVLLGFWKGMARIAVAIAALVIAFVLASRYQSSLGDKLVGLGVHESAARLVAYLVLFVTTVAAGGIVGWLLARLLKLALMGWVDRLAGAALGLLASALAAAFVIHPIVASASFGRYTLSHSKLAPYVATVAGVANRLAPADISRRYSKELGELRKIWNGEVEPLLKGASAPARKRA